MVEKAQDELKKIRGTVRKVVQRQFGPKVRLHNVVVSEDTDFLGDPILLVTVVHGADPEQLDGSMLLELASELIEELDKYDEHRFPVMSYVTREDYLAREEHAEAA